MRKKLYINREAKNKKGKYRKAAMRFNSSQPRYVLSSRDSWSKSPGLSFGFIKRSYFF